MTFNIYFLIKFISKMNGNSSEEKMSNFKDLFSFRKC